MWLRISRKMTAIWLSCILMLIAGLPKGIVQASEVAETSDSPMQVWGSARPGEGAERSTGTSGAESHEARYRRRPQRIRRRANYRSGGSRSVALASGG